MLISKQNTSGAQKALNWLGRYWFRSVIILVFLYAFRQKDISVNFGSMEVGMGNSLSVVQTLPATTTEEAPASRRQLTPPPPGPERDKWMRQQTYIEEYQTIAKLEMDRYGIPASITLAQGLLESGAGTSTLATRNHNHFGIKCFSKTCKKGHCSNFSDDSHKDFFRIYDSSAESYQAHSKLLTSRRYKHLLQYGKADYIGWANGLQRAGYATDPTYANKIIQLIEDFELYYFDRE